MEKIIQYHKINEIRPKYHELVIPFYKTSPFKIDINLNELDLYYNKQLDMYETTPTKRVGGDENNEMLVIHFDCGTVQDL